MSTRQVELIYFLGCPSAETVAAVLKKDGIPFKMTIQDSLPPGDPKRALSSPSIFVDGVRLFGSTLTENTQACSLGPSPAELLETIKTALSTKKWGPK